MGRFGYEHWVTVLDNHAALPGIGRGGLLAAGWGSAVGDGVELCDVGVAGVIGVEDIWAGAARLTVGVGLAMGTEPGCGGEGHRSRLVTNFDLLRGLNRLEERIRHMNAQLQSFATAAQNTLNKVNADLDAIVSGITALNDKIQALQNSQGQLGPDDQEALDGIVAQAQALADKADAIEQPLLPNPVATGQPPSTAPAESAGVGGQPIGSGGLAAGGPGPGDADKNPPAGSQ